MRFVYGMILFVCLLIWGVSHAGEAGTTDLTVVSEWGGESAGLRMRAFAAARLEQWDSLKLTLQFQASPQNLAPGVSHLNTFYPERYTQIHLTNLYTRRTYSTIVDRRPEPGSPYTGWVEDAGKSIISLGGTAIQNVRVVFSRDSFENVLATGTYECQAEFFFPKAREKFWKGTQTEWDTLWNGTVSSDVFRLEVVKPGVRPATKKKFWIPRKLSLDYVPSPDHTGYIRVGFKKADADEVELSVRNGFELGTEASRGTGHRLSSTVPAPTDLDGSNGDKDIDKWFQYKGGDKAFSCKIEVFETDERTGHFWQPSRSPFYKVLWSKTYEQTFTEEEIRKILPANAHDKADKK